jgi:Skp family chaperone for outer membrane proteins
MNLTAEALAATLTAAFLSLALPAAAQEAGDAASHPAPGPRVNVGVIDTGKAIDASVLGKAAASRVQERYRELQAGLKRKQEAAQARADELNRVAAGLSREEYDGRVAALQREVESVQAETARAEEALKSAAEAEYGPLYDRASELASQHARGNGLLMILENSDEDKAVIFADPGVTFIDITDEVTRLLDASGEDGSEPPARKAPRARRKKRRSGS